MKKASGGYEKSKRQKWWLQKQKCRHVVRRLVCRFVTRLVRRFGAPFGVVWWPG